MVSDELETKRRTQYSPPIIAIGFACLLPLCSVAQTASPAAGLESRRATGPTAAQATQASITHAMVKGVTLKLGTAAVIGGIFYAGTGSLAASGWLTALSTASSYLLFVTNDYLWDRYAPRASVSNADGSFNARASLWQTTGKYLTFKPAVTAVSYGLIYAFTGSVASTAVMGSAAAVALPAVFYVNNLAWDWYDWNSQRPGTTTQLPPVNDVGRVPDGRPAG